MQPHTSIEECYAQACEVNGTRLNSSVAATFRAIPGDQYLFLKELNFASNYFGDKGLRNLFRVLDHLPSLYSLNLRNNFITTVSLEPLTKA